MLRKCKNCTRLVPLCLHTHVMRPVRLLKERKDYLLC